MGGVKCGALDAKWHGPLVLAPEACHRKEMMQSSMVPREGGRPDKTHQHICPVRNLTCNVQC